MKTDLREDVNHNVSAAMESKQNGEENVLNDHDFENGDKGVLDDHTKRIGIGARRPTESR